MTWKQPIPVDLQKIFGSDHLSQTMFERLLIRARVEDNTSPDCEYWDTHLVLRRGQSVCGRKELGKWFNRDPKTIKRHLEKLQNEYKLVDNLPTPKGTIVTIKNFDRFVKWDTSLDNPKQVKWDNPGHNKDVVAKANTGIGKRKWDNPKWTEGDTNKNINTNNSKSFKDKSYSFTPKVLEDLTPEQRRKVEYL